VDAHFQRQFSWQTTDNRGDESLASTAHMGHELMMMMMMLTQTLLHAKQHFYNFALSL